MIFSNKLVILDNFRIYRNVKVVQRFPYTFYPVSPNFNMLQNHTTFVKTKL